ncbi:TPA: hypothetical protein ACIJVK_002606 [Klebsiella aerogenes]
MNNELTAALLTIEKCRELSGCPAGVDLQDWVKQLAAENLAQKNRTQQLIDIINNADNAYCMCGDAMKNHTYGGCGHPTGMFDYHYGKWLEHGNETTATDRIVAGIKADGAAEREKTITFTAAKKRTQDGVALIAIGKPYKIHNDDVIGEFFIGERGRYGVITMDRLDYFTTSDEYAWEFSLREGADK